MSQRAATITGLPMAFEVVNGCNRRCGERDRHFDRKRRPKHNLVENCLRFLGIHNARLMLRGLPG
jgi:hypothetical protein